MTNKTNIYESHPAMFKNRPIGFIITLLLCPLYGVGLLIFLIWWLKCIGTTLIVTSRETIVKRGILSKHTNEIRHSDVRNIQISQSLFQRLFNVGNIGVSSAGQGGIEILVRGLRRPNDIKDIINSNRE